MVALTTCLQLGDWVLMLRCRQASASLPPGVTPEHFAIKSERQACFIAFCCAAVGAAGAAGVTAFGGAAMAALGGGAGAGAAGVEAGWGATAAAGAVSAGLAGAGAATGAGKVALTAVLQAEDRLPTFFCRQVSASWPPGVTPEHFDMKSERQLALIALCCADVTCAAALVTSAALATANRQDSNAQ